MCRWVGAARQAPQVVDNLRAILAIEMTTVPEPSNSGLHSRRRRLPRGRRRPTTRGVAGGPDRWWLQNSKRQRTTGLGRVVDAVNATIGPLL